MATPSPEPNASATVRGVITAAAQQLGGKKTFVDGARALVAGVERNLLHPDVSVVDFGADPTGVADSAQAFMDAISSFGPSTGLTSVTSVAGALVVPPGTYRFAQACRVKKSVNIKGSSGASGYPGTWIKPDVGVEGFVFERYNTPSGTANTGASDYSTMQGLYIQPASKASNWVGGQNVSVGTVRRTGTGRGLDWRRHYRCTSAGVTANGGNGPRSLGNDKLLNYDASSHAFTREQYVTGSTSGAYGIVLSDSGTQLRLTGVFGVFLDDETITDPLGGAALVNGTQAPAVADELDGTARWTYLGTGAGVRIKADQVTLRDVWISGASGCGVHIEAPGYDEPNEATIADTWHLANVHIWLSDGHGLFTNGGDANGGSWVFGSAYQNGGATSGDEDYTGTGFNIYESSFLGNAYFQIQMGTGGIGAIFNDSIDVGSSFFHCYVEGTGGGENDCPGPTLIVGGGLPVTPFTARSNLMIISPGAGGGSSVGMVQSVVGYGFRMKAWRANVFRPVGARCVNVDNTYEVITAGTTAGAGGPTGTGSDITDGTCHWKFVHAVTPGGTLALGSSSPALPNYFTIHAPNAADAIDYTVLKHGDFGDNLDMLGWAYGINGTGIGGESGSSVLMAQPNSVLNEWPLKVPTGRAVMDFAWIGGCRVFFGAALPTVGTFNPGDRLFYKGAACVAGGAEGQVCVTAGTAGVYSGGRTATSDGLGGVVISGASMGGYVDQHDFKIGDKLLINGVTARVVSSSADGLTLGMSAVIPGGSGLPVAFVNPVWKTFGSIAA